MSEILNNLIYMARRFKTATALNLVGLILAFVAFYLLMTQIIYQTTYNHGIKDYERIYRMESDYLFNQENYSDIVCRPFADALQKMNNAVESYSLIQSASSNEESPTLSFLRDEDTVKYVKYLVSPANNKAISTLSPKVLDGSIEWSDGNQDGFIIPASIAKDYFGTVRAKGKTMLYLMDKKVYTFPVRGIYEDFPDNCELKNYIFFNLHDDDTLKLNANYSCYVKFKSEPTEKEINDFTQSFKQEVIAHFSNGLKEMGKEENIADDIEEINQTKFRFIPLKDSYFENTSFTTHGERGFKNLRNIMVLTCLLVILMATINFLNFTLAESPMRIRGLNTRLVLGASRRSLRRRIVYEGITISVFSCLIALLVCVMLHYLLMSEKLIASGLLSKDKYPIIFVLMLVLAIFVGIAASFYPSNHATSHSTSIALKSNFGLTPQGKKLRLWLVGFQLFISMLMGIYVSIIFSQSRYILTSDSGYDMDRILATKLPSNYDYIDENDTLYQLLGHQSNITDVAFTDYPIGQTDAHGTVWTKSTNDETFKYTSMHCSQNFLSALGIEIIEGRYFSKDDTLAIIVNQAMQKRWDWIKLGSFLTTGITRERPDSAVVVGVCKDIRFGTTRINSHQPFAFIYNKNYPYLSHMIISIKEDSDLEAVKRQVNDLLNQRYGSQIKEATYFKSILRGSYKNEFQFQNLITLIGFICLFITIIGVFCLTVFETEYRRKEIAIRKVAGATTGEIVKMLCRHYVWLIAIAFAVAAPLAFAIGHYTLRKYFGEHTPIHRWLFPLCLLLVGGTMVITVAIRSWLAAREKPADSIKSE